MGRRGFGFGSGRLRGSSLPPDPVEIAFVGSMLSRLGSSTSSSGGTVTVDIPLSDLRDESGLQPVLQEGDMVIANLVVGYTADLGYVPPLGYIEAAETYSNDTYDANQAVFYKFMGAVPDTIIEDAPVSGHAQACSAYLIHVLRGVDPNTPLDVAAVVATGANSNRPNPGAVTPLSPGAWIWVGCASAHDSHPVSYNAPADLSNGTNHFRTYNNFGTPDITGGSGFKSDWAGGVFTPAQWTCTIADGTTHSWSAVTLALRPIG